MTSNLDVMTPDAVEIATADDKQAVVDVLTLAFSADPAARWSWSDASVYLRAFPQFAIAFGGAAFVHGTAHRVDGCAGAALWLPPGVGSDEAALARLMEETVSSEVRKESAAVVTQMVRYRPKEPHWYLPLIGIDPAEQGKGYGSALLRHALAVCDRDASVAYLESSNPRNIPLYQRHGFEVMGAIQAGSSPTIVPMLRKPRRR